MIILKSTFEFMWCHKSTFQIILYGFENKKHPDDGSDVEKKFLFLVLFIQFNHELRNASESDGTAK